VKATASVQDEEDARGTDEKPDQREGGDRLAEDQ
jgi:hypothetical protein